MTFKLDVFGKHILSKRTNEGWSIFYFDDNGKRRPAPDIFVPEFVSESEIETYLADLVDIYRRVGTFKTPLLFTRMNSGCMPPAQDK